jgi:hypothetical protein
MSNKIVANPNETIKYATNSHVQFLVGLTYCANTHTILFNVNDSATAVAIILPMFYLNLEILQIARLPRVKFCIAVFWSLNLL